jgi:DNA-binding GntR family transcriptional regulator
VDGASRGRFRYGKVFNVFPALGTITTSPTKEEQVYERLRLAIVDGHVEPGQELAVATVAVQLGVSRIPVMRACQRLIGEGFLETNARRNVVVVPLTEERVMEEFELLNSMECMAVRAACEDGSPAVVKTLERINDALAKIDEPPPRRLTIAANKRFHVAVWSCLRSPYLVNLVGVVWDHLQPARAASASTGLYERASSVAEHQAIIDAVARRDAAAAEAAVRAHRQTTIDRVLLALRQRPTTLHPTISKELHV